MLLNLIDFTPFLSGLIGSVFLNFQIRFHHRRKYHCEEQNCKYLVSHQEKVPCPAAPENWWTCSAFSCDPFVWRRKTGLSSCATSNGQKVQLFQNEIINSNSNNEYTAGSGSRPFNTLSQKAAADRSKMKRMSCRLRVGGRLFSLILRVALCLFWQLSQK